MEQILIAIAFFILGSAFGAKVICNEEESLKGFQIGYDAGEKTGRLEHLQAHMTTDAKSLGEYFKALKDAKATSPIDK